MPKLPVMGKLFRFAKRPRKSRKAAKADGLGTHLKALKRAKGKEIARIFNTLVDKHPKTIPKYPELFAEILNNNKEALRVFDNVSWLFVQKLGRGNEEFFRGLSPASFRAVLRSLIEHGHLEGLFFSQDYTQKPQLKLLKWSPGEYMLKGLNKRKAEVMAEEFIKCYREDTRRGKTLEFSRLFSFFKSLVEHDLLDRFITVMGPNISYFRKRLFGDYRVTTLLAKTIYKNGASKKQVMKLTGVKLGEFDKERLEAVEKLFFEGMPEKVIDARTGAPMAKLKKKLEWAGHSPIPGKLEKMQPGIKRLFAGFEPKVFEIEDKKYVVTLGRDAYESDVALGILEVKGAKELKSFLYQGNVPFFEGNPGCEGCKALGRVKFRIKGNPKGKPRLYIEAIQGVKNSKSELEMFSKTVGVPWATYLSEILQEQARKTGFYGIAMITPKSQPFRSYIPEKRLRSFYALYATTAKALGFNKKRTINRLVANGATHASYYFKRLN